MTIPKSLSTELSQSRPVITVVATIYNSELAIKDFVGRCRRVLTLIAASKFEIILVDDNSTDGSLRAALAEREHCPEIVIVELARNYGQHLALLAGLRFAKGELVVCMDGDGDEDPGWIVDFLTARKSTGADIVIGSVENRRRSLTYRICRTVFLKTLGVSNLSSRNETTARLMTSRVVDAMTQYLESEFYFGGVMQELGFKRTYVPVSKLESHPTGYKLPQLLRQARSSITSFSVLPLRLLFFWGLLISIVAAIGITIVVAFALLTRVPDQVGLISVLLAITFFGGNSLLALGLIGEYLSTVLTETKRRPQYHIRDVHRTAS